MQQSHDARRNGDAAGRAPPEAPVKPQSSLDAVRLVAFARLHVWHAPHVSHKAVMENMHGDVRLRSADRRAQTEFSSVVGTAGRTKRTTSTGSVRSAFARQETHLVVCRARFRRNQLATCEPDLRDRARRGEHRPRIRVLRGGTSLLSQHVPCDPGAAGATPGSRRVRCGHAPQRPRGLVVRSSWSPTSQQGTDALYREK